MYVIYVMKFVNFGVAKWKYRFYDYVNTKGIYIMTDNLNQTPHDSDNMTVGEILRNTRTTGRRKREIPTISKQLCIREEFLQALEDGNYSVIPESVYTLGFARNYAMELGLDPDEIVCKLKREMGLGPECDDADNGDTPPSASVTEPHVVWYRAAWTRVIKFCRRYWVWILAGLVVLSVAIVSIAMIAGDKSVDTQPSADVAVVQNVDDSVNEPKYNVDVRERFGTENRAKAQVILQATQESWVKVEDRRGNTMFSRVLVPGDVYYVPVGDEYSAIFGNAGGIDVWVNGELAPAQGVDHVRVSGIVLSPDSLMKSGQ